MAQHPSAHAPQQACHPLDPLSAAEIRRAVDAVRTHVDGAENSLRFVETTLHEPDKAAVRAFDEATAAAAAAAALPRLAYVISWDKRRNETHVSIVDVGGATPSMLEDEVCRNVQPAMSEEEYELAERLTREYPPVVEALGRRGFRPEQLMVDPWCVGAFSAEDAPSSRLCWPAMFIREEEEDNLYARPLLGLELRIDLQREEVISFIDRGVQHIPPRDPLDNFPIRTYKRQPVEPKPLHVVQPEGPSFHVSGNEVTWLGWRFRVGFRPREGLILHNISVVDPISGDERPVANRLSFAEMVVPYLDADYPHYLKNAFDAGEDGLGKNVNSLRLGCDCLGHIHYFDADLVSFNGDVTHVENAVCLHEEDHGLLAKHTDWRTGKVFSARSRRLSISFIATIANYDYAFYFYLQQDGAIEFEVKLTGVLSMGAVEPNTTDRKYGATFSRGGQYAPYHQHFFVARMDMCVDGESNRIVEVEAAREDWDSEKNRHGSAAVRRETLLQTESHARRRVNTSTGRFWSIQSSHRRNRANLPTAYEICPRTIVAPPWGQPDATYLNRAGFLRENLWVTRYTPDPLELYPSARFPNQDFTGDGLHKWTAERDAPIVDKDLVVWFVFGANHFPRMEEFGVMPCDSTSFMLRPRGFFDANPCAVDGDKDDRSIQHRSSPAAVSASAAVPAARHEPCPRNPDAKLCFCEARARSRAHKNCAASESAVEASSTELQAPSRL